MDIISFFADGCSTKYASLEPVFYLLKNVINLIKIFVPILLVLFGTLDLAKAVIAGKEEEMKKSQSVLIKRIIYGVAVFLVVTLVQFVMGFIGKGNEWYQCWDEAKSMTLSD